MRYLIGVLAVAGAVAISASANAQELRSTNKNWQVYTVNKDGIDMCYMLSSPIRKKGNYSRRDEPFLMVTHINGNTDEVSATSGYSYRKGVPPRLNVDGEVYRLSTMKGERAWAKYTWVDRQLVDRMKKGVKLTMKGTSIKRTYSLDTFSLSGFTDAYNKMKSLCKGKDIR
jgi:invasion protein IalB